MGADAELLKVMGPELELLLPVLDERQRRLVMGAQARALGLAGAGLSPGWPGSVSPRCRWGSAS